MSPQVPMAPVAHTNGYEFTQGTGYALPQYPFVPPPELQATHRVRHPVVVVGAGITGLTLACSLAQLGVPAVVLDEDNTVGVKGASSRGICYTQKSLEIFQRLGIYERIKAKGIEWSVGRTFAGHDEVFSFDLSQQTQFNLSQQPPFINIQQFYIEGYLVERIQEIQTSQTPVDLRWMSRVVGFSQNDTCATLEVQTPAGNYHLEAEHVIDATGSHTPFHAWCQASMDALPAEYRAEPRMALAGGKDGMDIVRRIIAGAKERLTSKGVLVIEIGNEYAHAEEAFPELELTWLSTSAGDGSVFLLTADQL